MKIKFIAAPLVAGALMVPATLSTPAAQAAVPTIPAVSSNTADAHKLLEGVNGRITSLNDDLKVAKASLSPMEVIDTIADLLNRPNSSRLNSRRSSRVSLPSPHRFRLALSCF